MNAFIELLRPFNCVMAAVAVFTGYCVALGRVDFGAPVWIAMASAFLVCGGGQAINDYFDRGIDARLKKQRPIPSGRVSANAVLWFSVALFVVGTLLGLLVSTTLLGIAAFASIVLFAYSASMKGFKFLGNWVVALFVALTYVYGAAVLGNYSIILWLALCAGLSNVGREITKDLEDVKMDKGFKRTLPLVAGARTSKAVALVAYAAAIVLSPMPFVLGLTASTAFLAIVLLADLAFVCVAALMLKGSFKSSQKYAKAAMLLALIAYFAIVLVP